MVKSARSPHQLFADTHHLYSLPLSTSHTIMPSARALNNAVHRHALSREREASILTFNEEGYSVGSSPDQSFMIG